MLQAIDGRWPYLIGLAAGTKTVGLPAASGFMIVMKFGGTSVEDARSIIGVIEIVKKEISKTPILVFSAIAGATDTLIRVAHLAAAGKVPDAHALLDQLKYRHETIVSELNFSEKKKPLVSDIVKRYFDELKDLIRGISILGELTARSLDTFCSYGERLSTAIIAAAMFERGINALLMDARQLIITDDNFSKANPLPDLIKIKVEEHLIPKIKAGYVPVVQGYIGATERGITTTLGRGGSDYTAALIGAVLGVEDIQIWTDVDGILTADPRVIPNAKKIKMLSFAEASELAYFGAKVLHPNTILPAIGKNIPVHVYNSKKPYSAGTLIASQIAASKTRVKSIASKKAITLINIYSTRMLMAHGFMKLIFDVFDKYETAVDLVSTSEVSVSITVDNKEKIDRITEELSQFAKVTVDYNKAIVCVVGEQLKYTPGISSKIFKAVEKINIYMISQGASEINVSFVVDEDKIPEVVAALHEEFFCTTESELFEVV